MPPSRRVVAGAAPELVETVASVKIVVAASRPDGNLAVEIGVVADPEIGPGTRSGLTHQ